MKTSKIGDLNLQKFKTEIHITPDVKALFNKNKISLANLIPAAWAWYDAELFPELDENGDGKPDDKFGKEFKLIYLSKNDSLEELEQQALFITKTTIGDVPLKYICLKN
jgi:hypothetical protein